MANRNCAQAISLGNGYSLYFLQDGALQPHPKARSFETGGDRVQYAPDRPADVKHITLDIALDFERETITGVVSTTFSALYEEVKTVTFDAVDLHIESVSLSGDERKELPYSMGTKKLTVTLDRAYAYGEEFVVAIKYSAKPRTGLHFIKPAPEDPTRPVQAWTFGQPGYASSWFPCHDSPNDRATTEIFATVPAQFLTISNGNLLEVIDHGATKTHHWRHDVPHAVYLISLVVGDFAVIKDNYKGKPVNYYVRKDRAHDARYYLGKTPQMMQFFSEYTGVEYPYDTYDQTVVELYTGAMEHTTATTHSFMLLLDERASLDVDMVPVVAHELAHQWFGDMVTCRDWASAWLNEGFATYFEELWTESDRGNDHFKLSMLEMKQVYLQEDTKYRRPIVYYVYATDGFEIFDRHTYQKGGWVLHMLRHQLGDATFRRAIKAYLERYRFREVITSDLERTLEEVTGHSLARFFDQWIHHGGYPAFEVTYSWDGERKLAKIHIKQTQQIDELTPCFVTPVDLTFTVPTSNEAAKDENTTETHVIPLRVQLGEDGQVESTFYLPLEREPVMIRFDPDGWLLKTLKFDRSSRMMRYQLAHDADILGRIEAAEALGEQGGEENIQALQTALLTDAFWGVRVAAAKALGTIGSENAQTILLRALQELDARAFSRVRAAIAEALGRFQAPQQAELAGRSAQALSALLEKGDVSYLVEAAAALALGKTRTAETVDLLVKLLERPSWNDIVQRSIFPGLGASGEDRVVDIIATHLADTRRRPTFRMGAAMGMRAIAEERHLYSEEARQRAVTALCHAVEHDPWQVVRAISAGALETFGEKRAVAALERAAGREPDTSVQLRMRMAAKKLNAGDKTDDQLKQLRADLEKVQEENRKLKEQVSALEAKIK
jgi:aminopeptidase N